MRIEGTELWHGTHANSMLDASASMPAIAPRGCFSQTKNAASRLQLGSDTTMRRRWGSHYAMRRLALVAVATVAGGVERCRFTIPVQIGASKAVHYVIFEEGSTDPAGAAA